MGRLTRKQAIEKHITECKHRMEVIDECINHPDTDIEECNKNIFILQTVTSELERVQKYWELGTLEEIRAALEKQKPKKGIKEKIEEGYNKGLHEYYCPVCYKNGDLRNKCNVGDYCSECGQRLDWSE